MKDNNILSTFVILTAIGGSLYVFRKKWRSFPMKSESFEILKKSSSQSSMEVQTEDVESEKCECQDRKRKDVQTQTETRHAIWDYFRHNV